MCGPIRTSVSLCVDQWEDCFMLSNLQLSVARSVLTLMAGSVKPCSTDAGRFFCRTGGAGGTGWPVHLEKHSLSRNDGKIGSSSKAFTAGWGMVRWRLVSSVLFCSLAVLDLKVGHTVDVLLHLSLSSVILIDSSTGSPVDVVHPGCAWSSSPACTCYCSLHYLFLQATPLFPRGVTIVC